MLFDPLPFDVFFFNSLQVALLSLAGTLLACSLAAYAFARMRFPGREPIFALASLRADLRRRLVGFVFQSFHLLPALTAEENVMLPLELEGRADARARARTALEAVGLGARRRHYPAQLSGGEQQRVAIARAFVHAPRVLFADEPTGNLDQRTGAHIADLLFALNRDHHTTLVLVTHDANLAARCTRRVTLEQGSTLPVAADVPA